MIVSCAEVQRIKCTCGEAVCGYCRHRMSACRAGGNVFKYCPACGYPLVAPALNTKEERT